MNANRIAVIGDVGGHHDELYAALVALGADPDTDRWKIGGWPEDLIVVQVGDLVDRGPDSEGVLDLVDAAPVANWVQLVGNHEVRYLGGPTFRDEESPKSVRIRVRGMDAADRFAVAAYLHTAEFGDVVVTHAGCSAGFLAGNNLAGLPARTVAARLNGKWAARGIRARAPLWRSGVMLANPRWGAITDSMAGPIWASASAEVWSSWENTQMPFAQIHGHSVTYLWSKKAWLPNVRDTIHRDTSDALAGDGNGAPADGLWGVDPVRRHAWWRPGGGPPIMAIDPQHLVACAPTWAPVVVHGTAATPGMPRAC